MFTLVELQYVDYVPQYGCIRLEFIVRVAILIINTDVDVLDGRITLPGATIW